MEIIVMDTDFAYEYLSGNSTAVEIIETKNAGYSFFSFTAVAELTRSTTNAEQLSRLNARLRKRKIDVLQLDEDISENALELMQQFHLSHSASIPDILLAATAIKYDCLVATCNTKHFKHIPGLRLLEHEVLPKRGGGFLGGSNL